MTASFIKVSKQSLYPPISFLTIPIPFYILIWHLVMRFPYQLADGSDPYKVRWGLCKDVWPHHEVSFLFWMVTVNNIQSLDITNTLPPTCKSINIELVLVLVLMLDIQVFQGERCQPIKCKALPVIENNLRVGKQSV